MSRRSWRQLAIAGLVVAAGGGAWAVVPSASADDAPRITQLAGVTEGATLSGTARIEARTSGTVDRVEFSLSGARTVTWTERQAPWYFLGNNGTIVPGWDAATAPDGAYTLAVRAIGPGGTSQQTVRFTVGQQPGKPAPTPAPTPTTGGLASTANPSVSNGVATFTANKTIGKLSVPDSWTEIVIGAGVTLKGNFFIPANRTKALTINGRDKQTSQLTGDGPHVKDYARAGVTTEAKIKLTLRNYTSVNPRFYHMWARQAQVVMSGMRYIDNRDLGSNNSDGFSGGDNSLIENTFIDTWDDSAKLYTGDLTIRDTTIVHNRNGAPIQMAWGDYGQGTAILDGLTVISNSPDIYNLGVFSWAGGTKADTRTIKIVGDGFTRKVNPGMVEAPLYAFRDGVKNKTIRVEGGDCSVVRSTSANTFQGANTSGNKVVVTGCK
ncbi:hypothetical protein [Micromonospora coxensis]|uniref:Glycosyl hydrolase family 49 n=1 Tax=Micromonospora coxensis TaxID=356852 RepID=A0A1C5GUI3_9ACTN|nr:hypothetical protein [Micromonospora coxensis]SCG37403.1 Glycosyl hydrolase family 49 [Micromonospora coxensis]